MTVHKLQGSSLHSYNISVIIILPLTSHWVLCLSELSYNVVAPPMFQTQLSHFHHSALLQIIPVTPGIKWTEITEKKLFYSYRTLTEIKFPNNFILLSLYHISIFCLLKQWIFTLVLAQESAQVTADWWVKAFGYNATQLQIQPASTVTVHTRKRMKDSTVSGSLENYHMAGGHMWTATWFSKQLHKNGKFSLKL